MSAVIVTGGEVDLHFLKEELDLKLKDRPALIAADRGLLSLEKLHIRPDFIIGDFDSAGEEAYTYAKKLKKEGVFLKKLDPVKDDTDTEAALRTAFERTEGLITIYGATGTRIDHVIANLSILRQGPAHGREIRLIDSHNRVRLVTAGRPVTLMREKQFGKYVSVFPVGGEARGVTLSGFAYPLSGAVLTGRDSLGTSNEITEDLAHISLEEGELFLIESKD